MDIANATNGELSAMAKQLSLENRKNPMLLSVVIRCVLKFLYFEEIKNCRLVSREWSSTGKLALAKRSLILFHDYIQNKPLRRPPSFLSCFLDSASLFSAFKISGDLTKHYVRIEELTNFFDKQQKSIKELSIKFEYADEKISKIIDISSWISKSPMVQKNTKHMTKLSIKGHRKMSAIPLQLIACIKDLSLYNCRVSLEDGIQMCPIKIKLSATTFYHDGIELDRFRINDIVDLRKTKEVHLVCSEIDGATTQYVLDLLGNATLDKLSFQGGEIVYGKTSQLVNYSLKRPIMKIWDLSLSLCRINLETGIRICPCRLKLVEATFYQNGVMLDNARINDFVDFCNAGEVSLHCSQESPTKYVLDLWGSITLNTLILECCEIMNGETSQWSIEYCRMTYMPSSLNSGMKIRHLYLSLSEIDTIDLFTLPISIEKFSLHDISGGTLVNCSQPIVWENLQRLCIVNGSRGVDYSFLTHFRNCPQLTFLRITDTAMEMKCLWMPKSVKTVLRESSLIDWTDDTRNCHQHFGVWRSRHSIRRTAFSRDIYYDGALVRR